MALNERISEIYNNIKTYLKFNHEASKNEILTNLYGTDFLKEHKQKRTKPSVEEFVIKQYDIVPSELAKSLRASNPKKRVFQEFIEIDDDGFEVLKKKESIIDPLDYKNLSTLNKEIYYGIVNQYLKKYNKTIVTEEEKKVGYLRNFSNLGQWYC